MTDFTWMLLQAFALGLTIGLTVGLWVFKKATDEAPKPRYDKVVRRA